MRPQASWMNVVESVMTSTSGFSRRSTCLARPSTRTSSSRTIGPGELERDALAVGQAHLLTDDVAQRTLHLAQRDLSGDARVVGHPGERGRDVTLVDPEIEDPDGQESPIGAGARRHPRGALKIPARERGQILPPAIVGRADPIDEGRAVETRRSRAGSLRPARRAAASERPQAASRPSPPPCW